MSDPELSFKVEQWSPGGRVERLLATADNLLVARAAFHEAVIRYPKANITLRQRARVIEERKPANT